jgi:hypothetical protein
MKKREQDIFGVIMFENFEADMEEGFYDDYGEEKAYSEEEMDSEEDEEDDESYWEEVHKIMREGRYGL